VIIVRQTRQLERHTPRSIRRKISLKSEYETGSAKHGKLLNFVLNWAFHLKDLRPADLHGQNWSRLYVMIWPKKGAGSSSCNLKNKKPLKLQGLLKNAPILQDATNDLVVWVQKNSKNTKNGKRLLRSPK
jgi:hypothetical protein